MMSIEGLMLYTIVMGGVGYYLAKKEADKRYERGLMDAIQMHNEGRLTYTSYFEDDVEMLDIRIGEEV